jgi:integral membrane protein
MTSPSASVSDRDRTRKLLRWVAIAAAVDFLLLIPLVYASLSDNDSLVSILGPIHGVGFLIQLYLTVRGAGERLWGWWFPAIVVVTLGPPGALIGHVKVSRDLERG